jgi:flagellar hook-length control protein FliK
MHMQISSVVATSNGAPLSGLGAGAPSTRPPGALPTTAPASVRKPFEPSGDAQPADFSAFIALASGAGFVQLGPVTAPLGATAPTAAGAKPGSASECWESSPLGRALLPGGRFSPPSGNSVPPGMPRPAPPHNAGENGSGRAAALATETSYVASALTQRQLPEALTQALSTATQAAALPARWTHVLLAGERDTTSGDALATASHDSLLAGDALLATANNARAAPTPATVAVPTNPAQQPAFEQALGERLAWLVQEGRHDARIKLHPAELGSLDIRLSLDGDSTRISLASPHAAVRDALEQAVPRLRELLGSAGLDLSQVNVGTGDARSHGDLARPATPSLAGHEHFAPADDAAAHARTLAIRLPQGLVDTFA